MKTRSFLQYWGEHNAAAAAYTSASTSAGLTPSSSRILSTALFAFFHPKGADLCSVVCSSYKMGSINTFQAQRMAKQANCLQTTLLLLLLGLPHKRRQKSPLPVMCLQ